MPFPQPPSLLASVMPPRGRSSCPVLPPSLAPKDPELISLLGPQSDGGSSSPAFSDSGPSRDSFRSPVGVTDALISTSSPHFLSHFSRQSPVLLLCKPLPGPAFPSCLHGYCAPASSPQWPVHLPQGSSHPLRAPACPQSDCARCSPLPAAHPLVLTPRSWTAWCSCRAGNTAFQRQGEGAAWGHFSHCSRKKTQDG